MEALQQQISQVANTIDCSRYSLCCGEHKEHESIAELSKGDAVHFRWIQTNPQRQGTLTYSCFAILKAFLHKVEGLRSCTFYTSLDGTKIAGLGVWENAQAAYGFISPPGSPAEPYWKSLGAKLRCGICEVVYVTSGWGNVQTLINHQNNTMISSNPPAMDDPFNESLQSMAAIVFFWHLYEILCLTNYLFGGIWERAPVCRGHCCWFQEWWES